MGRFKHNLSYQRKVLADYQHYLSIQTRLLKIIKSTLPDHLVNHVLYCVPSNQTVILFTNTAAWSSQLRFYQQAILQSLSIQGYYYNQLKVKIIPEQIQPKRSIDKKYPSQTSIDTILDSANNQTDKALRRALFKLANTFTKRSRE